MIRSGLVSVTFRKLSPQEIVDLVVRAGLEGIEWGGDIHVPHGDLNRAREVRRITQDAGLKIAAYGSYYRVGHAEPVPFETVLATAVELGAPNVRVWAGEKGSETADAEYRGRVVQDSQRIADLAGEAGITVSYEFHERTLTDTGAAAARLLQEVSHDNIRTYWQPPDGAEVQDNLEGLQAVLPWLSNVHAYHLDRATNEHLFLAEGEDAWRRYLREIASTGREHFVLLEFVKDGSAEVFLKDAETLKGLLRLP